ncbi:MAG TPA: DUF6152 family protein [Gammaproteobacteria bacterium]|nr:DUF6152 family protein [Gammaproteobacteria bacterium]
MDLARGSILFTGLALGGLAYGHHSDAVYDRDSLIVLEAQITRYIFRNPHVTIFVAAEDATGNPVEWEIETGSTPIMQRSGWTRDFLSPGDAVIVRAHPARNGERSAILATLETGDGRLWSQIERDADPDARATSLAGVWKGISTTSLGPQLREAVLTPAGRAARDSYDAVADSPSAQCIANPPPFHASSTNYLTGIEILDDRVMLRSEFFDVERTVYTDGREHPADLEPTNQGHSIGRWEDGVLVVDTVGLAEHRSGNGGGIPSSTQRHVVERYYLSEDRTRAIVDVFFEDPVYLAEPFEGRTEMTYVPHLQLYRYDCVTQ